MLTRKAWIRPTGGLLLACIFEEAGLPAGVLSVVVGAGLEVGDDFVAHPTPALISFTGSTPVGKNIGRIATGGKYIKKDCRRQGTRRHRLA